MLTQAKNHRDVPRQYTLTGPPHTFRSLKRSSGVWDCSCVFLQSCQWLGQWVHVLQRAIPKWTVSLMTFGIRFEWMDGWDSG